MMVAERTALPSDAQTATTAADTVIAELTQRLDTTARSRALVRLGSAFIHRGDAMLATELAVFGALFDALLADAGDGARAILSEQLAELPHAPQRAVLRLAMDPLIRVARPVLSHSPVLSADDLMAVIDVHGPDHLVAIAGRRTLDGAVAERLARSNNLDVVAALLRNGEAPLSKPAMLALLNTATRQTQGPGRLGDRDASLDGLIAMARARSAHVYPPDRMPAPTPAIRNADAVERNLAEAIAAKEWRAVAGALSDGRTITPDLAEVTLRRKDPDLILVLSRLNNLSFEATRDLVVFALGAPLGEGAARRLETDYARISPTAARRAIRFLSLHASRMR